MFITYTNRLLRSFPPGPPQQRMRGEANEVPGVLGGNEGGGEVLSVPSSRSPSSLASGPRVINIQISFS